MEAARRALEQVVRAEAKDIRTKYVEPPYTTNFGILFLPFEGLYAEVVNQGMVETLQRDYQVNVAGPSTMAALLNSLQMGFKTLAIQKRSNEVWQVLGAVKTEFEKFDKGLAKLQERLRQSDRELDDLIGTRHPRHQPQTARGPVAGRGERRRPAGTGRRPRPAAPGRSARRLSGRSMSEKAIAFSL